MAQLSNQDTGLRAEEIKSETSTQQESKSDTETTSGPFFKKVAGLVSEYITKEFNIPSTAFTPAMVMTTKKLFSNMLIAIDVLKQLKQRVSSLMEIFDQGSSSTVMRKKYVKKRIEQSCKRKGDDN